MQPVPPIFDKIFRAKLNELFGWRRDVRRFLPDPIAEDLLNSLLETACLAPSVGNSQPWRFVRVDDPQRRAAVIADFEDCNAEALANYQGDTAQSYASLKLSGLRQAPVHLAVFCDRNTTDGKWLGRRTMPETLEYSVVSAIQTLWLAARSHHVGLGWVSILRPETVTTILDVPADWKLIGYLCLGYPQEEHIDPELVRHKWQERRGIEDFVFNR